MIKLYAGELSWPSNRMTCFTIRESLMFHLIPYRVFTVQAPAKIGCVRLMWICATRA